MSVSVRERGGCQSVMTKSPRPRMHACRGRKTIQPPRHIHDDPTRTLLDGDRVGRHASHVSTLWSALLLLARGGGGGYKGAVAWGCRALKRERETRPYRRRLLLLRLLRLCVLLLLACVVVVVVAVSVW